MRARKSVALALFFAALLCVAAAPAPGAEPVPASYTLTDFQLEDGSVLPELRIAYETHGALSPARDNAIVLLHGVRDDRHSFSTLIGPGKLFDTDRYFVIVPDAIGGGESASPADGAGQDFPRYTIRDTMTAEYALVAKGLELARVRAVIGRSLGAYIALEWAVHHPASIERLVLIGPDVRTAPSLDLIYDGMATAIALDPEWRGGRYTRNPIEGLRHAGMVYYPWTVTAHYLDRLSPRGLGQEVEAMAQSFADWDANSLIWRYAACRGFDIAAPFNGDLTAALARVTMPVLLMASSSDRLVGTDGARRIRDGVPQATYVEIVSELGHLALDPPVDSAEHEFIDRTIRPFLAADR